MSQIVELLKEKNYYLERFLAESQKERSSFKARRFENLDTLYRTREQIIDNIQSIDFRIQELCGDGTPENIDDGTKDEVRKLLAKIKHNVRYIMEEDLTIISSIEREKTKIIREISNSKEGRRALNAYKSKLSPEV